MSKEQRIAMIILKIKVEKKRMRVEGIISPTRYK